MGYGVIGSPTGSGPVSLGSSPGTPATCAESGPGFRVAAPGRTFAASMYLAPSSSGPGRRPLKAVAPVQIRSGLLIELSGPVSVYADRAFSSDDGAREEALSRTFQLLDVGWLRYCGNQAGSSGSG